MRKELEEKLEHISENISHLSPGKEDNPEPEAKPDKVSLQDHNSRKQYYAEAERQRQEAAEFARKLKKDKDDWQRKKRKKEQEELQRLTAKMDAEA